MTTLTLQEAIFTISNLRRELSKEYEKFSTDYRVPVAVNNEKIDNSNRVKQVDESLEKIKSLKEDLVTLKTAIHLKNSTGTITIDGKDMTASTVLESLKVERDLVQNITNNIDFGYGRERIKTVSGVGIVEEGIINEEVVREYLEKLEKDVQRKSILIDKFNSTEKIEVTLNTL